MNHAHNPAFRAAYFRLAMEQDIAWLRVCIEQPSAFMRKRHVDLIRLAIRKKAGGR